MPVKRRTFRSFSPAFDGDDGANDRKRTEQTNVGTVTAAHTELVFRAPAPVKILQVSLVVSVDVSVNASNYWEFQVANQTKSVDLISAAVSTADTAMDNNVNYDLDPDQNLILDADDVLEMQFTENGSITNLQDTIVIVDYEITDEVTTTSTSTTTTTTTTTSTSTTTTTTTTTTTSTSTTVT